MSKPEHFAEIEKIKGNVAAKVGNIQLASSDEAVELKEHYRGKEYPAIIYFPRDSVDMQYLKKVDDYTTSCPIKGSASYYDLIIGDQLVEKAAWSYEDTLAQADNIKDYVSFDKSKLDIDILVA